MLDQWPDHRVILIRADAGFGKTALAGLWAIRQNVATDQHPGSIAWLTLDPNDGDPVTFMKYFAAAADRLAPGAQQAASLILQDTQPDPQKAMRALLARLNTGDKTPRLLIIDDCHLAASPTVYALLNLALEQAPDHIHFLLLTESWLDIPALTPLLLSRQALEMTSEDLRFDKDEIALYTWLTNRLALSPSQLAAVLRHSGGRISALKLAGLTLFERVNSSASSEQLDNVSEWQADNLLDEILARQQPDMQQFLMQTALLERLCPEMCEVVTGLPNAAALLREAYRTGLFLTQLDGRGNWYSYHTEFRKALLRRLESACGLAAIADLYRQAAAWCAVNGSGIQAVNYYLASGDTDGAAALVARRALRDMAQLDYYQAGLWLNQLPEDVVNRYPRLLVLQARLPVVLGDTDFVTRTALADAAWQQMAPDNPERLPLEADLTICRATVAFARRRLEEVDSNLDRAEELKYYLDDQMEAHLYYYRFVTAMQRGQWSRAEQNAVLCRNIFKKSGNLDGLLSVWREEAVRLLYTGRGIEAARQMDNLSQDFPPPQPYFILRSLLFVHMQTAEIHYWLNQLDHMYSHIRQAATIADQLDVSLPRNMVSQLEDLHRLSRSNGGATAQTTPRPLDDHVRGIISFSSEWEIIVQVKAGQPEKAAPLIDLLGMGPEMDPMTVAPNRVVLLALWHLAMGHDPAVLDRVITAGLERFERVGQIFFLGRLQAIEAWRQLRLGNKAAAETALAAAMKTATQTGVVRAILDIPELEPLRQHLEASGAAAPLVVAAANRSRVAWSPPKN